MATAGSGAELPMRGAPSLRPPALHVALDVDGLVIGSIIGAALVATGLGTVGLERVQHLLLILLTLAVGGRAIVLASTAKLTFGAAMVTVSVVVLVFLSMLVSDRITGNHLYLAFLVAIVIMLQLDRPLRVRTLVGVTNVYYLAYLALSLGVYLGFIDLGRSLNAFDATMRLPGLSFTTLVGFYGSTAHIDSISLFVVLINLLFGRGAGRYVMICIALLACLASVRFTPFVSLGLGLGAVWVVERVKRAGAVRDTIAAAVGLAFVLSAPLTLAVSGLVASPGFDRVVNTLTTGRLLIWQEIYAVYRDAPLLNQVFGTGTTEPYYLVGGWPRIHPVTRVVDEFWTANAHNSYFAVALTLGVIVYVLLAAAVAYFVSRLRTRRARLISLYLLAVGITNAELFTFYFPVYVIWAAWLVRDDHAVAPAAPSTAR